MHSRNILCFILLLYIPYLAFSQVTSRSPLWIGSTNYSSGSVTITNAQGTLTVTYTTSFAEDPQKMILGIISQIASTTSTTYNLTFSVNSNNKTAGVIKYGISNGIAFTSFSLRWLVISKSYSDISCNGGINFLSLGNCSNVNSGTG